MNTVATWIIAIVMLLLFIVGFFLVFDASFGPVKELHLAGLWGLWARILLITTVVSRYIDTG